MNKWDNISIILIHFSDTLFLACNILYYNKMYNVLEYIKRDIDIKRYLFFPVYLHVSKYYITFEINIHNIIFAYG
jgi:hypothetical protein